MNQIYKYLIVSVWFQQQADYSEMKTRQFIDSCIY